MPSGRCSRRRPSVLRAPPRCQRWSVRDVQPRHRAGPPQAGPGGTRLGDARAHRDPPFLGKGASSGSSQRPGVFLEHQQGRRLGQGPVLALQLPGQALDLLAFGALLGPFGLGRQGGVGLAAGLAPDADLLRKQPLVPAVLAHLQFVEAGRLHHRREFRLATPGPHGGRQGRRRSTPPNRLAPPPVEGIARDTRLAHQLRHADVVGRQHLGHHAVLQFCRIRSQARRLADGPRARMPRPPGLPFSHPTDSFPAAPGAHQAPGR